MNKGIGFGLAGIGAVAVAIGVWASLRDPAPEAVVAPGADTVALAPADPGGSAEEAAQAAEDAPGERAPEAGTETGAQTGSGSDTVAAGPTDAGSTDQGAAQSDASENAAPELDLVRVEPDGQIVLAGRATANAEVEIVLGGDVIGTAQTGPDGSFATVLTTPPSGDARALVVRLPRDAGAADDAAADDDSTAEPAGAPQPPRDSDEPDLVRAVPAPRTLASLPDDAGLPPGPNGAETDAPASIARLEPRASTGGSPGAALDGPIRVPAPALPRAGGVAGADRSGPAGEEPAQTDRAVRADAPATTFAPEPQATPVPDEPAPALPGTLPRRSGAEQPIQAPAGGPRSDPPEGEPDLPEPQIAYIESAPVIILPGDTETGAPLLVRPGPEDVTIEQARARPTDQVVLDRITYTDGGDVTMTGRGAPGMVVRVYVNAELADEAPISADGAWRVALPAALAEDARLLRVDEIDGAGRVTSRLETPFVYSRSGDPLAVRQREIVVQRGDFLWRIAEQYYGEGIRYSVIYDANANLIRDPDLIYPGQVFTVPELVSAE